MHPALMRSEGVSETLTAPSSAPSSWERFEALYRSSRDDVYAYVCTLLRDPAAAEDVTALAFERAYRRRRRRLAALVGEPADVDDAASGAHPMVTQRSIESANAGGAAGRSDASSSATSARSAYRASTGSPASTASIASSDAATSGSIGSS